MGEAQQWTPIAERVIANGLYGITVGAVIFVIGLVREWWVMGAHFRAVVKDKDEYKALSHTSEETAKKILELLAVVSQRLEASHRLEGR
jgi:tetrahydromethanopterin S-methyltransferase subunit G